MGFFDKHNVVKINKTTIGKVKKATYKVTRKDNKPTIDIDDLDDLLNGLEEEAEKKNETIKIMLKGMNCQRLFTLKGYDEDLHVSDFDDYYKQSVRDVNKFEKFSELYVTVLIE